VNWTVFTIFAYVFLAVQSGLVPAMRLASDWPYGPVSPRLELILVVFVGLFAARRTSLAAWATMGLAVDLLTEYPDGVTLIGPFALGFLAGGLVLHHLRGMVLRTHPLSLAFSVFVCGLAVQLVVVAIFAIRASYDPMPGFSGGSALAARLLGLIYTAAIALVLAWPLMKTVNLLGLQISRQIRR
jgi:hypothetical protein